MQPYEDIEDDGTPAWLREASPSPPVAPAPPAAAPAAPAAAANGSEDPWGSSPYSAPPTVPSSAPPIKEPDAKLKQYMLGLRLANMVAAILLCVLAVLTLGTTPDFTTAVLAIYVFVFAVMLFCFELALEVVARVIADNMGFFYNAKGRLVFIILIGILCFDLKPPIFGIIMGSLIMLIALINFYTLFRFPEFEEYQRRKHLYGSYTATGPAQK